MSYLIVWNGLLEGERGGEREWERLFDFSNGTLFTIKNKSQLYNKGIVFKL